MAVTYLFKANYNTEHPVEAGDYPDADPGLLDTQLQYQGSVEIVDVGQPRGKVMKVKTAVGQPSSQHVGAMVEIAPTSPGGAPDRWIHGLYRIDVSPAVQIEIMGTDHQDATHLSTRRAYLFVDPQLRLSVVGVAGTIQLRGGRWVSIRMRLQYGAAGPVTVIAEDELGNVLGTLTGTTDTTGNQLSSFPRTKWGPAQSVASLGDWSMLVGGHYIADGPDDPGAYWPGPPVLPAGRSARTLRIPRVYWTIDERAIDVEDDWRANVVANGGCDQMSGRIPEAVARRWSSSIDEGARIRAHTDTDRELWDGDLYEAPAATEDGRVAIVARGRKHRIEGLAGRRLYQTRDYSLVQDGKDPPFNLAVLEEIEAEARSSCLFYRVLKNEAITNTQAHSLAFGAPGALLTRYAFDIDRNSDFSAFDLRVLRFTYPNKVRTLVGTHNMGAAQPTSIDVTLDVPEDALNFQLYCNSDTTPVGTRIARLINWRVNGIAIGDTMTPSEIAADLGLAAGYDVAGVVESALNGLPFDILSGPWSSGLDYQAILLDWRWRLMPGDRLDFGPYAREWNVFRTSDAAPKLRRLPLFNGVAVAYENLAGVACEVTVLADPDPHGGKRGLVLWPEQLSDRQPDDALATAVANNVLPQVSKPRYVGAIEIVGARDAAGRGDPYEVAGGDVVRVGDWGPAEALTLRVEDSVYTARGATLGIEAPVSGARAVALAAGSKSRRRQKFLL